MPRAVLDLAGQRLDLTFREFPVDLAQQQVAIGDLAGQLGLEPVDLVAQGLVPLDGGLQLHAGLARLAGDGVQGRLGVAQLGLDLGPRRLDQPRDVDARLRVGAEVADLLDDLVEVLRLDLGLLLLAEAHGADLQHLPLRRLDPAPGGAEPLGGLPRLVAELLGAGLGLGLLDDLLEFCKCGCHRRPFRRGRHRLAWQGTVRESNPVPGHPGAEGMIHHIVWYNWHEEFEGRKEGPSGPGDRAAPGRGFPGPAIVPELYPDPPECSSSRRLHTSGRARSIAGKPDGPGRVGSAGAAALTLTLSRGERGPETLPLPGERARPRRAFLW